MLEDENLGEREKCSVRSTIAEFSGSLQAWNETQWCCVTWVSGGSAVLRVHPSFRAFLEDEAACGEAIRGGREVEKIAVGRQWLGSVLQRDGGAKDSARPQWLKDSIDAVVRPRKV